MKQKSFFAALLLLFSTASLWASDTSVNGIWYDFDLTSMTASVTYQGAECDYSDEYSGSVVIPESVTYNDNTYSVISIGDYAFADCGSLTSVTISNSVKNIGNCAFYGCIGLSSITIPNNVTSIGALAFYYCSSLTSVTWNAKNCADFSSTSTPFYYNKSLSSYNFNISKQITTFTLGEEVEHIPSYLCSEMSRLASVSIPNSVTSIGEGAFSSCNSLTSITIPNSVTILGDYAFGMCGGLTTVTIPSSVTNIGNSVFGYCRSLNSVTIPNSITSIGDYAFYCCSSLTSITIPSSVKSIGNSAFLYCGLKKVIISDLAAWCCINFAEYSANPLNNAKHLYLNDAEIIDLVIPNTVTKIGAHAFRNCVSLTSVSIPKSVTNIGSSVFSGCIGLLSMSVETGNTIYDSRDNCNAIIKTASNTLVAGCQNTIIPNDVTSIGEQAFSNCSSLTAVTIPNSVTSIGNSAFSGCSSLASVTIPNSVTTIGTSAFNYCTNLASVYYESATPATITENTFLTTSTIYVPQCAFYAAYNNAPVWKDLTVVPVQLNLQVVNNVGGEVVEACGSMKIEAVPFEGYHFQKWHDGNKDNPRSYSLSQTNLTFYAQFAPNRCTLEVLADANKGTIVGEQGEFDYMSEHTIEAISNTGYLFTGWSDGVTDNPRTIVLTTDTSITAIFDHKQYSIVATCNEEEGSVEVSGDLYYQSTCTITATPNNGYHFTQWSDGNADNPRAITVTKDETFTAEFAIDKSGTCGDNLALTWTYDSDKKELTISGEGALSSNYTFGIEAPTSVEKLTIAEGVTAIGNSAFANYTTIKEIVFATSVKTLYEQAFYNCANLTSIYCYRERPGVVYSNTFEGVDKFDCTLYVPAESIDMYKAATGWRDFYFIEAISGTATAIDSTSSIPQNVQKVIRDGQLIIIRNGKSYTIQGQEVR